MQSQTRPGGSPRPEATDCIFADAISFDLSIASLTAATTRSCSISGSPAASRSMRTETNFCVPVATTVTAPPPAVASTVSVSSSFCILCMRSCICCTWRSILSGSFTRKPPSPSSPGRRIASRSRARTDHPPDWPRAAQISGHRSHASGNRSHVVAEPSAHMRHQLRGLFLCFLVMEAVTKPQHEQRAVDLRLRVEIRGANRAIQFLEHLAPPHNGCDRGGTLHLHTLREGNIHLSSAWGGRDARRLGWGC